jgi:hypothetical protein
MPPARLPIREGLYHRIWTTVVAILRDSDALSHVKTWKAWEGLPGDDDPPAVSQSPWIRLTPVADPGGWRATGLHQLNIVVQIEAFTAGTRATDLMDLWDAIVTAMFPQTKDVYDRFREAGALGFELRQPSFSPLPVTGGAGMMAIGMIAIFVHAPTHVRTQ